MLGAIWSLWLALSTKTDPRYQKHPKTLEYPGDAMLSLMLRCFAFRIVWEIHRPFSRLGTTITSSDLRPDTDTASHFSAVTPCYFALGVWKILKGNQFQTSSHRLNVQGEAPGRKKSIKNKVTQKK